MRKYGLIFTDLSQDNIKISDLLFDKSFTTAINTDNLNILKFHHIHSAALIFKRTNLSMRFEFHVLIWRTHQYHCWINIFYSTIDAFNHNWLELSKFLPLVIVNVVCFSCAKLALFVGNFTWSMRYRKKGKHEQPTIDNLLINFHYSAWKLHRNTRTKIFKWVKYLNTRALDFLRQFIGLLTLK